MFVLTPRIRNSASARAARRTAVERFDLNTTCLPQPLALIDAVVALGVAQVVLTWPLVAVCVLTSWWVLRRTLPADHPGLRHPRPAVTR